MEVAVLDAPGEGCDVGAESSDRTAEDEIVCEQCGEDEIPSTTDETVLK